MKFYEENKFSLYLGDCIEEMKLLEDNSIDSIVTDPPYNLSFMGKKWDNVGSNLEFQKWCEEWAKECLRVLKPGGHILAFGAPKNYHRLASGIEDAGFEIRDSIFWMVGQGWPKGISISKAIDKKLGIEQEVIGSKITNIGLQGNSYHKEGASKSGEVIVTKATSDLAKKWDGWNTALKPAYEPIVLARKPIAEKSIVDNVLTYGTGAINIDECRIPIKNGENTERILTRNKREKDDGWGLNDNESQTVKELNENGRYPSNVIWDGSEELQEEFDKYGIKKSGKNKKIKGKGGFWKESSGLPVGQEYGDSGSISRFFYSAKASKKDRDEGIETTGRQANLGINKICSICKISQRHAYEPDNLNKCDHNWTDPEKKNNHPTVKPTELMEYLIKLITPKGGVILDPFAGSGSTGKAAMRLKDFKFIGIEVEEEYLKITKARIIKETSMIHEVKGDCLKFKNRDSEKKAIVIHCCNNIGAWGSGFVIALNDRFGNGPKQTYLNMKEMKLGNVSAWKSDEDNCIVFNIIGQEGVVSLENKRPIRYDAIYNGCEKVYNTCNKLFGDNWEVHMPKMGAGLAQGNWSILQTIINETIAKNGIDTYIYEYNENEEIE